MSVRMFFAAVLLLSFTHAWPADNDGKFMMHGPISCGTFVEARKSESGKQQIALWMAGFITAYNWRTLDTADILANTDMAGALLWMENYCRAHPLESVVHGAMQLTKELFPKRRRSLSGDGK